MSDDKPTVDEVISDETTAPVTTEAAEEAYEPLDMDFGLTEAIQAEADEEITDEDKAEYEAAAELEEDDDEDGGLESDPEDEDSGDEDEPPIAAEAEETDAVEEEAEKAEEEPAAIAKKKAPKKQMVPKARLDEVLAKQRELQKQLTQMQDATQQVQEQKAAEPEYAFEDKEMLYQELVLDGESKAAAALRQEIRAAERAQMRAELKADMTETVGQDRVANAMQTAANQIEQAFPVFDSKSEYYDEALTNEVISLRDAFITQGLPPVEALGKAATYTIKANDMYDGEDLTLGETSAVTDEVAKKRRMTKKKLKAAGQQPPELPSGSSTKSNEGIDLNSMTDSEFAALPEATLKRLRGDIV